ncbi:MAG: hypothetical protein ACQERE_08770 [Pseudomonadota bacterium]
MASMHGLTTTYHLSLRASCLLMAALLVAGCMGGGGSAGSAGRASGGQTKLDWKAPLTRVDGSKLYPGQIRGYRVYYRRPNESDFRVQTIDDADTTEWQPNNLPAGEYLFAVSTVDTSGLESPRSETLRVTIP